MNCVCGTDSAFRRRASGDFSTRSIIRVGTRSVRIGASVVREGTGSGFCGASCGFSGITEVFGRFQACRATDFLKHKGAKARSDGWKLARHNVPGLSPKMKSSCRRRAVAALPPSFPSARQVGAPRRRKGTMESAVNFPSSRRDG